MVSKRFFFGMAIMCFAIASLGAQQRMMNPAFAIGGDRSGRDALGLCCSTQASLGNNPTVMNLFSDFRVALGNDTFTKESGYAKIQGSAYYEKEFKKATIYSDGEEAAIFYVRYDAFNDDIEVKRNKHNLNVESLVRSNGISCEVDGEKWTYAAFLDESGQNKKGYLMTLYEGSLYQVYVRNIKTYKEGKAAKTSFGTYFPPRFLDKTEYYVSEDGGKPQHLKLRKKEVLAYFDGMQKESMHRFIKKKALKFDTRTDLAKVFQYADSEKIHSLASMK